MTRDSRFRLQINDGTTTGVQALHKLKSSSAANLNTCKYLIVYLREHVLKLHLILIISLLVAIRHIRNKRQPTKSGKVTEFGKNK
jgi:hypothetical protein